MYYDIKIPKEDGTRIWFSLNFWGIPDSKRIEVPNVCIISIYKAHDHRYDLKAFFYDKKYIYYQENIRSKKELYSAIQKLLKENLNVAVQ
jgi:hypothetical protein